MFDVFAAGEQTVIQIGLVESLFGLAGIILAIGIAWGSLKTKVTDIDKDVEDIKEDVKAFTKDIASIKAVVTREYQNEYAKANSPRKLTEKGQNILDKSGIKEVIDGNKDKLLEKVKAKHPATAYDAELCVLDLVSDFIKGDERLLNTIKEKTFALGETIEIVIFVGGIYFRDYALPELGFNVVDVDKKPKGNIA